ncbi:MAG: DsbA family protein [Candidatus Marinarcus sp.]|uniref:DsbA family protein n=1 Tax=Candidatus Marinarcus sp. TaxID=3100987 RepID=UPI003AFFF057
MKNKSVVVFVIVAVCALFIALGIAYKQVSSSVSENRRGDLPPYVRDYSLKMGENSKNVVVVEFIDPQCIACAEFYPVVKKVFYNYEKEIQLVIRYLPIHKYAANAVQILEAARKQGKFNEMLEALFQSQAIWGDSKNNNPNLIWNYVVQVEGIDMELLKKDLNDEVVMQHLQMDEDDAKTLGVTGTPTLFVNGKPLETLSYKALSELIESEIYK